MYRVFLLRKKTRRTAVGLLLFFCTTVFLAAGIFAPSNICNKNVFSATDMPKNEPPSQNEKVVYLTFDDGPSALTEEILDVLLKYEVKASFFVVAERKDNYLSLLKREAEEGHTVALHSYSHRYKTIYASEQSYFDDLAKLEAVVYMQTG